MMKSLMIISSLGLFLLCVAILYAHNRVETFAYPFDTSDYNLQSTSKEMDTSFLTTSAEAAILDLETQKCKHISADKTVGDEYDIIKNYRFLNHPTDESACYFKTTDTLVNGKCSKRNTSLYEDSFADAVENIVLDKITDPYLSKTFPESICKVSFNNGATDTRKQSYAAFIDSNDPKEAKMKQELKTFNVINDGFSSRYEEVKKTIKDLNEVQIPEKDKQIRDIKAQIDAKQSVVQDLDSKISQRDGVLKNIHQSTNNRNLNSSVLACMDANLPNNDRCGAFHIGEFNMDTMQAHRIQNDRMQSLYVPENIKVTLYDNTQLNGQTKTFVGPVRINSLRDVNWENSGDKIYDTYRGKREWNWRQARWNDEEKPKPNNVSSLKVEPIRMYDKYYS